MRKKITVLFLSALMVCVAAGCGKKEEEAKDTVAAKATVTEAPETQAPKETVSANETDSDGDNVSKNQAKKTTKKKNKKNKKKAQVTTEGAQETPSAAALAEQARAQAQAQAEAQARAEEERLAAEAEAARLAEEEAQRLAAEAAITEQDIPQDTAVGSAPQEDAKAIAESYIGAAMNELISAIGQPQGENRMPSCNGPGEDVQYNYPGFSVIVYADENGVETIVSVE